MILTCICASIRRTRQPGRLALDDALKQMQMKPGSAYEGWSEARIRAYQMIEQNPNSYYYRFNAPGEEQRKGAWSDQERELFFKRLQEFGANGQWGIFSMAIPGRVGYQASDKKQSLVLFNRGSWCVCVCVCMYIRASSVPITTAC